jgi:hypothetical protein
MFADRERKIMTTLFVGDSQVATSLSPLGAMGQDAASPRTKLSENMSQFVAQSSIDFRLMLKQPWI